VIFTAKKSFCCFRRYKNDASKIEKKLVIKIIPPEMFFSIPGGIKMSQKYY